MSHNKTDMLLFQAVKSGNVTAFEILFKLYYSSLCQQAFFITKDKMVAEEIVSDILLKVWRKRDSINIHTTVRGYFFLATRNAALNHLKARKPIAIDVDVLNFSLPSDECSPLEEIISQEALKEWEQKISQLPEQRQKVFRMNKLEGRKYKEIAQELSLSENTVRNHVQLALQTLTSLSTFLAGSIYYLF